MKIVRKIAKNLNKTGLIKLLHLLARKSFKFWEKHFSLHITPAHFYSPIPVTYELDSGVFEKIYDCTGIDWNLKEQLEYLNKIFPKYHAEYTPP